MATSEDSATADTDRREVSPDVSGRRANGRLALIVEGHPQTSALLADSLATLGWRTVVARGPEHALRLADEHSFDLLVADAALGTTSGGSLAASLTRQQARPVVLIAGLHDPAGVELWLPGAFMPAVHGIDTLFRALGALFEREEAPA
jgi:CheY-like chemotaxis protein